MAAEPYGTLAEVYDWLVPDALLTPDGSVAAFAEVVEGLTPGARVLDCAAGTGLLAVGLARRGFDVVATDASPAMVDRIRALDPALPALVRRWDELGDQGWDDRFDAVFCVGNSLTHAAQRDRALRGMASVLRRGGLLVLTSRSWERVRAAGSGLEVDDRLVERHGRRALVARAWTIGERWDDPHHLDVAVAFVEPDGRVRTHAERLAFWPFPHADLDADLRAAGLTPRSSTHADDAERYLVTAVRS